MHLPKLTNGYKAPEIGEKETGVCTHITSLTQIEMVLQKYCADIIYVQQRLEDLAKENRLVPLTGLSYLSFGIPCAAKYPIDDAWYRAEVLGTEQGKIVVEYIDFGGLESLDPEHVKKIPDDLTALPRAAVSIIFTKITESSIGENDRPEARQWLKQLTHGKVVTVAVSSFDKEHTACIGKMYIRDEEGHGDVEDLLLKTFEPTKYMGVDR